MNTITLTIITKNEEARLKSCLLSAKDHVDEIVVVDTGSTDNTKQLAKDCGAKVYDFTWTNSFADARNFALEQATSDWILVLDADEQLDPETASSIRAFTGGPPRIGRLTIVSKYLENNEIRYTRSPISRLFPRGVYYKGSIHEQVVSDLPHHLTGAIVYHDGYFQTDKTARNLPLLQEALKSEPENPYLHMQVAREWKNKQDYLKADSSFTQAYQLATGQEGYFPSLVVDYLYNLMKIGELDKGYLVVKAEQERLYRSSDFNFASGMFYMDYILANIAANADKLPRIEAAFLRCLELGERAEFGGVVGTGSFLAAYNLGVYYEVVGAIEKALQYYHLASEQGYEKAIQRLRLIKNGL